jgi:catechol 2,3-dioxygenase-like lactoylglutathione lyase family enzyme
VGKRPNLHAIVESSLYVANLDRSARFYEDLLGLRPIFRNDRLCAMSVSDKQVLLLFKRGASATAAEIAGGTIPGHDASGSIHAAFSISLESVDDWTRWFNENHIPVESTVSWGRGGKSLYFRDPDDHLIELVTPGTWEIY